MKRILIALLLIAGHISVTIAQNALWATGSAVPNGTQELVKQPDGKFRYTGALNAGELKIMTTATYQEGTTQFLAPQLVDSYVINYGLKYTLTKDETKEGWVVSFQEDTYRIIIDTNGSTLKGELFLPWNELLIAGSAFYGGSDNVEWKRDNMLPFTRDHENPYVFEWTGELGIYDNVIEPGYFKLEGQMTWGPRELHPYEQGEDIRDAKLCRIGGDDTKWRVTIPGTYRIRVNLLEQTIEGQLITGSEADGQGISPNCPSLTLPQGKGTLYDMQGRRQQNMQRGLNIVRQPDGSYRKVYRK